MSGKTGKRLTGNKPSSSQRTDAKTDGAFGKETIAQTVTETERNRQKSAARQSKAKR